MENDPARVVLVVVGVAVIALVLICLAAVSGVVLYRIFVVGPLPR